jgi:hypothetical protein
MSDLSAPPREPSDDLKRAMQRFASKSAQASSDQRIELRIESADAHAARHILNELLALDRQLSGSRGAAGFFEDTARGLEEAAARSLIKQPEGLSRNPVASSRQALPQAGARVPGTCAAAPQSGSRALKMSEAHPTHL